MTGPVGGVFPRRESSDIGTLLRATILMNIRADGVEQGKSMESTGGPAALTAFMESVRAFNGSDAVVVLDDEEKETFKGHSAWLYNLAAMTAARGEIWNWGMDDPALAKELGVHRTLLYKWRERMENKEGEPAGSERKLRAEIRELKRVLAEKTLEVDFFRGALQKIEARRQNKGISGGKASTPKSGS